MWSSGQEMTNRKLGTLPAKQVLVAEALAALSMKRIALFAKALMLSVVGQSIDTLTASKVRVFL